MSSMASAYPMVIFHQKNKANAGGFEKNNGTLSLFS